MVIIYLNSYTPPLPPGYDCSLKTLSWPLHLSNNLNLLVENVDRIISTLVNS